MLWEAELGLKFWFESLCERFREQVRGTWNRESCSYAGRSVQVKYKLIVAVAVVELVEMFSVGIQV